MNKINIIEKYLCIQFEKNVAVNHQKKIFKSSHLYLYSTFNNTNCNKATAQYQNSVSIM